MVNLFKKMVNSEDNNSYANNLRRKRFEKFKNIMGIDKISSSLKILDIGGTEFYWQNMGFNNTEHKIYLLNLFKNNVNHKNFYSIQGNAIDLSEFKNMEFDIVFSNSCIEHLFTYENQKKMANEVRRVGKSYYVQTPNYFFPIEPHFLFPFFQNLPLNVKFFLIKNFSLGWYNKAKNNEEAFKIASEIRLLKEKEMNELFPDGKLIKEFFLGFTKSLIIYKEMDPKNWTVV